MLKLLYNRLGQLSSSISRKIISSNKIDVQGKTTIDFFYPVCLIANNHKQPFSSATSSTTHSLELLHCDLWGPTSANSIVVSSTTGL